MNRKNKIIIFGSLSAILLSFVYWQPHKNNTLVPFAKISDADYYFEHVKLTRFDTNGQFSSQLKAKKMSHYDNRNLSSFENPFILLHSESQSTWNISSNNGQLDHSTERLTLDNNVIISQNSLSPKEIKTQDLVIDLNKKYASTKNTVLINVDNNRTTAIGMEADFSQEIIQLNHNVETLGLEK